MSQLTHRYFHVTMGYFIYKKVNSVIYVDNTHNSDENIMYGNFYSI